jgi:two-component system, LytTR family, sensor kinase
LKSKAVLYHSLFWAGIYLLWVIIFRSYSISITKTMTVEFCYLIFITADYYAINHLIIPRFLNQRKYVMFIAVTLIVIVLSSWLRALLALQMNLHFFHTIVPVDFRTLYFNSLLNITLWVLLITISGMLIERRQTERLLEYLEKERVKNELDYLKAQINPHALFNSLNTIYGHIDKSNQVARNILLQFSEILRYQLYDCGAEKVSLEKEIEYIKNYVAFQQLRKDDKLKVSFQVEIEENGLTIAPLLLVVLIENAFKYVSNFTDRENKICIKIGTKGNVLNSSFINTKEQMQANDNKNSTGIGISNLKRRLELLYHDKYKLTSKSENEWYETELKIDLS